MDNNTTNISESELYKVYENAVKFLEYRMTEMNFPKLSKAEFINMIKADNVVEINTINKSRSFEENVIVKLLAPNYFKNNKPATIRSELNNWFGVTTGRINTIIISSETWKNTIKKYIANEITAKNYYIESYSYDYFAMVTPTHSLCYKHIRMTAEQVKKYMSNYIGIWECFPKILSSDPMARWYDIRTGEYAKIIAPSEMSGESISIRYCIY